MNEDKYIDVLTGIDYSYLVWNYGREYDPNDFSIGVKTDKQWCINCKKYFTVGKAYPIGFGSKLYYKYKEKSKILAETERIKLRCQSISEMEIEKLIPYEIWNTKCSHCNFEIKIIV